MYIDFKSENRLAVACLEKNSEFRWLIINGTNFFQNIAYFKTSRSCSNATKIGVRVPLFIQFLMVFILQIKKNFRSSFRRKNVRLSLFSYEISEFTVFTFSFFFKTSRSC